MGTKSISVYIIQNILMEVSRQYLHLHAELMLLMYLSKKHYKNVPEMRRLSDIAPAWLIILIILDRASIRSNLEYLKVTPN